MKFGLTMTQAVIRSAVPFLTCLTLLVLSATPLYLPGLGAVVPGFTLMGVFYWSIYRPDLVPAPAAFALGLLQDAVTGMPFGVNALVFLLVQGVVSGQGRFFLGKSFLVTWWAFLLVAAAATLVVWLLMMGWYFALFDPLPALFQGVLTVALYPFIALLLARLHGAAVPAA